MEKRGMVDGGYVPEPLMFRGKCPGIGAITYPRMTENLYEMSAVLSRKKQMMPYLTDLVRRLQG